VNPELEERGVEALLERQVDGIVYAMFYHRVVTPPAGLLKGPAVLLDARSVQALVSSVVPDEVGGGRAAVEELLAAGHRRIGFVTTDDDVPARGLRLAGFRQALEVYEVSFDETLVVVQDPQPRGGYLGAMHLLRRVDRPTGIFCFNGRVAVGVTRPLANWGCRSRRTCPWSGSTTRNWCRTVCGPV